MENLKNSLRQAASTSSADWQLLEAQCAASSCTVREKAQLCVDTLTAHELAALTASVLRNTVQQQQQQQPQQQPLSAERAALLCVLFSCYLTGSGEPVFALRNCLLETSCVASLALFYIHAAPSATQGQQQQQQQPQNEAWINALELLTLLLFSPATLHHLYELLSAAGWEALLRKVGEDMAAGALDTGDLGQRRAKAGLSWVHALQYAIGKMRASKWQDKVVSRGGAIASLLRAAVQLPNGRRADAFDYLLQRGQARPSILQFAMLVVDEATAIELLGAERLQAGFSYVLLGLADDLRSRRDPNTLQVSYSVRQGTVGRREGGREGGRGPTPAPCACTHHRSSHSLTQRSIYALVNNLSQKPALADILLRTRVPLSGAGLRGTVSAFDVLWALRTIGGGGPHGEACLDVLAQRFFCHHDHKLINVAARAHFSTARAGGSADEARRLLPAHYIVALADLVRILQGEVGRGGADRRLLLRQPRP